MQSILCLTERFLVTYSHYFESHSLDTRTCIDLIGTHTRSGLQSAHPIRSLANPWLPLQGKAAPYSIREERRLE